MVGGGGWGGEGGVEPITCAILMIMLLYLCNYFIHVDA